MEQYQWQNAGGIRQLSYQCGHCGNKVGPNHGYQAAPSSQHVSGVIMICPVCSKPTFFDHRQRQLPSVRLGSDIKGISDQGVLALYNEARDCTSQGAYTAAVLVLRKLLMNVAVQHGATAGDTFVSYVEFLEKAGFVPPNGKAWVDEIRKKGNEATHEIKLMTEPEAKQLISFVEMLLRFVYEFPSMLLPSIP